MYCSVAERDSWARVKTGMYKDDLARVIDVDYSTGRATIEVVPRIDYTALGSKEKQLPFGRTPTVRPAPRYVTKWKQTRSCHCRNYIMIVLCWNLSIFVHQYLRL